MSNLTLQGTPTFNATGKFGSSLNGGNGYAPPPVTAFPFTIEGWIKGASTSTVQVAFGRADQAWIGKAADNTIVAHYGSGTSGTPAGVDVPLATSISAVDGAWHHVALVVTSTGGTLYVDGAQVNTSTTTSPMTTRDVYFGVRGFFVTNGSSTMTFGWGGEIDEVAVWNTAKYTAPFTAPTAAYSGSESGLAALYHLNGDGTDSAGVGPATAITLSGPTSGAVAAPSSNFTVTANGVITGTVIVTPNDAGNGGSFTPTNVSISSSTPNATFTYTPATAGAKSILVTNNASLTNPASVPYVAAAAAALDTSKVLFSPANWYVTTSSAKSVNDGAYFKLAFTGASCTLGFDTSGSGTIKTLVSYRVDGVGAWYTVELAASIVLNMPSETSTMPNHTVEFRVAQASGTTSKWSPQTTAVIFNGITLASGGALLDAPPARKLKGIFFGDSIQCGVNTLWLTAGDETTRGRAQMAYPYYLEQELGAEIGVCAFGGQGWTRIGGGNVPIFPSTWNSIYSGVPRSFDGIDFIVLVHGQNDVDSNNITSAATTWLNNILAITDRRCQIIVCSPLTQKHASELVNAIAACTTPARVNYFNTTGLFDVSDAPDAVHPGGTAHLRKITPGFANFLRPLLTPVKGSRTMRTISLPVFQDAAGTIPAANQAALVWSYFDQTSPSTLSVPSDSGNMASITDGVLSLQVYSTKPVGGQGYLVLSTADGTKAFKGAVTLS